MLLKVLSCFKPLKCKLDQVIQEEGVVQRKVNGRCVNLIKEGDFELSKTVQVDLAQLEEKKQIEPIKLLGMRGVDHIAVIIDEGNPKSVFTSEEDALETL